MNGENMDELSRFVEENQEPLTEIFLTRISIEEVRHLGNIDIVLSDNGRKHLILTGKNGSGKTSLLEALSRQIDFMTKDDYTSKDAKTGLSVEFNVPFDEIRSRFEKGESVLAYYEANRTFNAIVPKHVEKVELKDNYGIAESPRNEFVKYILDLKVTEAMAKTSGRTERADGIHAWFDNFERLLKQIFEDDSVKLNFDEESFAFTICQDGRKPFDFQQLSDGYAAVLDIVVDLMVRMAKHLNGGLSFDLPGIVLIDEIETHLHLQLQKKVMSFLSGVFPNIQFIISTHSPFVLSSIDNAVIYDLENRTCVKDGLSGLPYEGIVKGYFEVDTLSEELRNKFECYKALVSKSSINDDDIEEIAGLEMYLDEIPDYLALGITTEYRRLKTEFELRRDL